MQCQNTASRHLIMTVEIDRENGHIRNENLVSPFVVLTAAGPVRRSSDKGQDSSSSSVSRFQQPGPGTCHQQFVLHTPRVRGTGVALSRRLLGVTYNSPLTAHVMHTRNQHPSKTPRMVHCSKRMCHYRNRQSYGLCIGEQPSARL